MLETYSQGNFAAATFSNSAWPGGGSVNSMTCPGVNYADRPDIEKIFGQTNVLKWADTNNNGNNTEIAARICWALLSAETYINERLLGGPYAIPFVDPFPQSVIDNTARLAGVILYECRGVTDTGGSIGSGRTKSYSVPKHQLTYHRTMVEKWINDILSMQSRIVGNAPAKSVPFVATE